MRSEDLYDIAETADFFMHEAVKKIDKLFGNGYAYKNPKLVSTYMGICNAEMRYNSNKSKEPSKDDLFTIT